MATRAYDALRAALVSGDLKAGEALMENPLAERLGMSRTPVREALSLLARDGLVGVADRRGYFVPQRSMDDLRELFELREALEGMAARYAALRATDAEVERLHALCAEYECADSLESWTRLGTSFHAFISAACRNRRLAGAVEPLQAQIELTRHQVLRSARDRRGESIREHRAIAGAIAARDPDAAEGHARAHVRLSFQTILRAFQRGPETVPSNHDIQS